MVKEINQVYHSANERQRCVKVTVSGGISLYDDRCEAGRGIALGSGDLREEYVRLTSNRDTIKQ